MQKKFYIICCFLLVAGLMGNATVSHGAPGYRIDVLEPGNNGGWEESLKTFDDEWTIPQSETVEVDIWLHDVTQELLTAGFWIEYNPEQVSIETVKAYDGSTFTGPWDPGFTNIIPEADGPGTFFVACGQFSCVDPKEDDVILGRLLLQYSSTNDSTLTIQTIPGFDTIVQCPEGVLDQETTPYILTLHSTDETITGCDDGIVCTVDSLGPDDQCLNIPNDTLCDDGLFCNGTETCYPLSGCQAGSNPCNPQEECNEEIDECIPIDEPCTPPCDEEPIPPEDNVSLSLRLIPQTHLRSHWMPLPLFMFIFNQDEGTAFDKTTTVHFTDEGIVANPLTFVLSKRLLYVFSLIRIAEFGSSGISEVATTVTTNEGSSTETLQIITLPFF